MNDSKPGSSQPLDAIWKEASRAVKFLESLGFAVNLTPTDPQILAQWKAVQAEAAGVKPELTREAAQTLGLLKDEVPKPVEVKVALPARTRKLRTGPGVAPYTELAARFMAAHWKKDWNKNEVWSHIKGGLSNQNKSPGREVSKALSKLHCMGFLKCVSKGSGRRPSRYQLNKGYDPNHPGLKFLKDTCPNGFRDIRPDYMN